MVTTLTWQKEIISGSDDWECEEIEIPVEGHEAALKFLQDKDDLAYQYYVTEWSGDPNNWKTDILRTINGEEFVWENDEPNKTS